MGGGLFGLVSTQINDVVRRNLTIYGLQIAAVVVVIGAAGFLLDALHGWIAMTYGAIIASLAIGGGLFVLALLLLGIASYLRNRKRATGGSAKAAMAAAPLAVQLLGSRLGSRLGLKFGLAGGIVLLGILLGRSLSGGGAGDES